MKPKRRKRRSAKEMAEAKALEAAQIAAGNGPEPKKKKKPRPRFPFGAVNQSTSTRATGQKLADASFGQNKRNEYQRNSSDGHVEIQFPSTSLEGAFFMPVRMLALVVQMNGFGRNRKRFEARFLQPAPAHDRRPS